MATLADGLALLRMAEGVADLGTDYGLTDHDVERLNAVIADEAVMAAVAARTRDEAVAGRLLADVRDRAHARDDGPELVTGLAILGRLIVVATSEQPTSEIRALVTA